MLSFIRILSEASFGDLNTLNLDPDPEFLPKFLDPDLGLFCPVSSILREKN